MGFLYWRWAAIGLLMGMLGLMIALGMGRRRGTRLHSVRIGLWVMVVTLGGAGVAATGCSARAGESDATADDDSGDTVDSYSSDMCYLDIGEIDIPDSPGDPDADPDMDTSCVECYVPWDPYPDAPDTIQDPTVDETVDAEHDGTEVEDGDMYDIEAADDDAEDDGEDAGEADAEPD